MFEAVALWRRFPGEIASDLSQFHQLRIRDWHRYPDGGDLSSYELIELCEFMDDDGRYKKALRKGEWSDRDAAIFGTANEVAVLRAGQFPDADADQYGSRLFIPPAIAAESMRKAEEAARATRSVYAMADIRRQPGHGGN